MYKLTQRFTLDTDLFNQKLIDVGYYITSRINAMRHTWSECGFGEYNTIIRTFEILPSYITLEVTFIQDETKDIKIAFLTQKTEKMVRESFLKLYDYKRT